MKTQMNILAIDDERPLLRKLVKAIKKATPDSNVVAFLTTAEALEYMNRNEIDVAFIDINMPGMDGISFAKKINNLNKDINIIFVTGYSDYAIDAFKMYASGYILKPVNEDAIRSELDNLRFVKCESSNQKVKIKCFGNFGVFIDNKPLLFSRTKTKELLAYLVHQRGATVTPAEAAAILWEDREYNDSTKSQMRNVIAQLMQLLRDNNVEDIVRKGWNSLALEVEKISCDYYDFIDNKNNHSMNAYKGEYMSEYSWAEVTAAYLSRKTE